jgi:YjbE family integral membrane protein
MFSPEVITAFFQVIAIDLVLAGDNAIVIGLAAAGLPAEQRAGGILLLWVCWKMWRELRETNHEAANAQEALAGADLNADGSVAGTAPRKTLRQATIQIIIADVSMSLDNVLAVAGAAREHPWVLAFGLVLSIALMGVAASFIARLLNKHRWIAYVGLLIILYVALDMIFHGGQEVWPLVEKAGILG